MSYSRFWYWALKFCLRRYWMSLSPNVTGIEDAGWLDDYHKWTVSIENRDAGAMS